jgi:hypothetical protein
MRFLNEDTISTLRPSLLISKGIWVTKDGRTIHVSKMSDSHLSNTIRVLEKAYFTMSPPIMLADMAQMLAEQEYADEEESLEQAIDTLRAEQKRRDWQG